MADAVEELGWRPEGGFWRRAGAYGGVGEVSLRPATFAAFVVFCAAGLASAEISFENYCSEAPCRAGNRVEDKGFTSEPWKPFATESPLIWVADACLGYFVTRGEIALNVDAVNSGVDGDGIFRIYAELGDYRTNLADAARLTIFNYPFSQYGVFLCENLSWPPLEFDPAEFERWVDARMTAENGWTPTDDLPSIAQFRNEKLGARVRLYGAGDDYRFNLMADYFGPPIVFVD